MKTKQKNKNYLVFANCKLFPNLHIAAKSLGINVNTFKTYIYRNIGKHSSYHFTMWGYEITVKVS